MEAILAVDRQLFELINSRMTCSLFDLVMPVLTDLHKQPLALAVLFAALLLWLYRGNKRKIAATLLATTFSVLVSDSIAYHVIKKSVERERPNASEVTVNLRTDKHSGFSFPSNHATNVFSAATAASYFYPQAGPILFSVATLVAYSRVYVGVHYPSDVLAGAALGLIIGFLTRYLFRRFFKNAADSFRGQNSSQSS